MIGRISLLASCILLAACAQQTSSKPSNGNVYMQAEFARASKAFEQCESKFKYDPDTSQNLSPYQVSSNELAARRCYYDAIQSILVPSSRNAALYAQLVQRDRSLTRAIQQRRVTRAQRRAQINKLISEIVDAERSTRRGLALNKTRREQMLARDTVQFLFSLSPSS